MTEPRTAGWVIYAPPVRGRSCGSCTACCTQVPVELADGHKGANVRCKHVRSTGCSIYGRRPETCVLWNCRWLIDEGTADMRRPDHAGYVVDCMLDTILVDEEAVGVVQVWCDPKRRDAHRDPALRAYLDGVARVHRVLVIVRRSATDAIILFPPSTTSDREWHELSSNMLSKAELDAKLHLIDDKPHRPLVAIPR